MAQINFYLSAVDDLLRHKDDAPSIGLILCKSKNEVVAEYAPRDVNKPIGMATHLTRKIEALLPQQFQYSLPTIEEIEAELARDSGQAKLESVYTYPRHLAQTQVHVRLSKSVPIMLLMGTECRNGRASW